MSDGTHERLSEAMELNPAMTAKGLMDWLAEESRGRQERGRLPLRKINRRAIYQRYLQGKDTPPLETLEAMAEYLRVRPEWLAFESGPMERNVISDPLTELYLVDGAFSEGFCQAPETTAERREIRSAFMNGFTNARYRRLEMFVATVHHLFANYISRYMQRFRDNGERGPDNPRWRGEQAAAQLDRALDLAASERHLKANALDKNNLTSPKSTAAIIWALAQLMVNKNP